ncbi:hypothetical protein [Methylobacterium sp. J-076]|uniref:hypothetical protein n=1 Tax=Methylobacterium sp. J-076 TaxID=2836655 RepID=UPI001FB908C4|nr:hypothetical protein [Methylobacterium sp. J-076]MCJ2015603.1 hypothetical protein [Methylobacterium sp. J-076]
MSNLPFHLRIQLGTLASRITTLEATAQVIRDESEAAKVNFNELTARLRALRSARDAEIKVRESLRRPVPRATVKKFR